MDAQLGVLPPKPVVAWIRAKGYEVEKLIYFFSRRTLQRETADFVADRPPKSQAEKDSWRYVLLSAAEPASVTLTNACKHHWNELPQRHRGANHTDKVPIAANVNQAKAEAAISIEEEMMIFLVRSRWWFERVGLSHHANQSSGFRSMEPGISNGRAIG
jgi:hypothetical protein